MSEQSANLAFPFLQTGQLQKHVTVNEALLRLDALVHCAPLSASIATQPASATDGAVYVLPAGKSGTDWAAMADGALAYYRDGAWEALAPRAGFSVFLQDTRQLWLRAGAAWAPVLAASADAVAFTPGGTERARINADGRFLLGASAPFTTRSLSFDTIPAAQIQAAGSGASLLMARFSNDNNPARIFFAKSRAASVGGHAVVAADDELGTLSFGGSDGAKMCHGANISVRATAAPGANYTPSSVVFQVSNGADAPQERLRIGGDGAVVHAGSHVVIDPSSHVRLRAYSVAALPAASPAGQLIYVSDGAANRRLAVSDGASWRWPDGAVVS